MHLWPKFHTQTVSTSNKLRCGEVDIKHQMMEYGETRGGGVLSRARDGWAELLGQEAKTTVWLRSIFHWHGRFRQRCLLALRFTSDTRKKCVWRRQQATALHRW